MQVVAVHFVRGGIGAGAMSERIKGVLPLATSIPVLAFLWIEFALHCTFAFADDDPLLVHVDGRASSASRFDCTCAGRARRA